MGVSDWIYVTRDQLDHYRANFGEPDGVEFDDAAGKLIMLPIRNKTVLRDEIDDRNYTGKEMD